MTQSGDVVKTVSGRFSGSALFIFSQLRQGVPLSKALATACEKGLCEPDPRDDLNDVDTRAPSSCSAAISGSSSS